MELQELGPLFHQFMNLLSLFEAKERFELDFLASAPSPSSFVVVLRRDD